MIKVKLILIGDALTPERELNKAEKTTVTSTLFNGVDAIYYQGDEPINEQPIEN